MPDKIVGNDFGQPKAGLTDEPERHGPQIDVDGVGHTVPAGVNLLEACLSLGLDLPYFCWHPSMGSVGACRQCAVIQYQNPEDTEGRLVMACMTPVSEGMRVSLRHPAAREFRAEIIEFLMTNHPHDCPVCEEGGECHLQDMTEMTGHTFRHFRGRKRTHRNQDLGPFINHEMNRCIACYRCVRYYQDYCGGHDLQVFAAHNHVYFGRHEDGTLENEFSGNLVEVCPTGVFTDKTFSQHYTRKWDLQSAPSVCVHCGLGCNISPGERYGNLRRIVNRYHGEINGYFLCDRGRFGYGFVNHARRICEPLVHLEPAPAPDARDRLAQRVRSARGLVGIGSPRASVEANFALRELVGAENFHRGVADGEGERLDRVLDILRNSPVRAVSLREAERADAVFVLGEDVTQTAARLALSLRQAVRNRAYAIADGLRIPRWQEAAVRTAAGQELSPLFVASPAPTRLDEVAAGVYRGAPDALARLGFAVAHRLNAAAPAPEIADPELDQQAGLIAEALRTAERPLIVSGLSCQSEAVLEAAAQVAWALASLRGNGPSDVHFAVPECNSLGIAMLGGRPLAEAFAAVEEGRADTVVVLENDLFRRAPKDVVERFLARAGHLVVLDHTLHDTARRAELILPTPPFSESEGTLISSEGRAQRFFAVRQPGGAIRESWRWLGDAGNQGWRHVDELVSVCAAALPAFGDIVRAAPSAGFRLAGRKVPRQTHRYSGRTAMLADVRIHEPKQPVDTESALAFSMEGASAGVPSALRPFAWAPGWNSGQSVNKFQAEIGGPLRGGDPGVRLLEPRPDAGFAWFTPKLTQAARAKVLRLVALYHLFGSEELSVLSDPLAERAPQPYLALHPEDAAARSLQAGDLTELELAGERIRLPVVLLPGLARGLAGLPTGLPGMPWFDAETAVWSHPAGGGDEG